jgi:hypothetical protein
VEEKTDGVRAVPEGFGEVSFENRERRKREDRGEQQADRPAARHRDPLCRSGLNAG